MAGTAAIVVISDDALGGSTMSADSRWLCRTISDHGGKVTQICTVPDCSYRIRLALSQAFATGPKLVVTVGGVGEARESRTLMAIAQYAGLPLRTHPVALAHVRRRHRELAKSGQVPPSAPTATPEAQEKLALLPVGGTVIANDVGIAPALHLVLPDGGILALPGRLREAKHIVRVRAGQVLDYWLGANTFHRVNIAFSANDPSVIACALDDFRIGAENGVHLNSRARQVKGGLRMTATLSAWGPNHDHVSDLLDRSVAQLRGALAELGIPVVTLAAAQTR